MFLAVGFSLWVLRNERLVVAYPNDSSVHSQMVAFARHQLSAGHIPMDGWYSYLSLGSPFFVQYQSASAVITGALALLVGTPHAFSWTLYLLLSLWPLCVYWAGRLLGWNRWASAVAAAISPLLNSVTGYGYEHQSYVAIGSGLWAQLWAMWTLPLAWGFSWRAISQRRYQFGAVVFLALTIAFHFLTAYLAGLTLVLWMFLRPREIVRRFGRVCVVGVGAVMASVWVTLPLLVDAKWIAANEFQVGTFWDDSYGARKILGWLVTGKIYDNGRFPIVTILVGIGLAVCLIRFRIDERARALVAVWVLSLLLFFGRPTLKPVLDLLPGNGNLLFPRYIVGVQLAGLFLCGVAVVSIAHLARLIVKVLSRTVIVRLSANPKIALVGSALSIATVVGVLAPAWTQIATYDSASATWIHTEQAVDATAGSELDTLLAKARVLGPGRIYAGLAGNWGHSFTVGGVPVYIYMADSNVDAIGFTLRTTSLMTGPEAYFDETNLGDYAAFGVRYLLLPPGHPPPVPAQLVARSGPFELWTVEPAGFIQVVETTSAIAANGSNLGAQTAFFLHSDLPSEGIYPTIAYAGGPAAPPTLAAGATSGGPAGVVISEHDDLAAGRADAIVNARRTAVVLLNSAFDPGWTVTVDGAPAQSEMIVPALVGVTVSPGRHAVVFAYRGYGFYPLLFALAFLTLVAYGVGPKAWRRFGVHLYRH